MQNFTDCQASSNSITAAWEQEREVWFAFKFLL